MKIKNNKVLRINELELANHSKMDKTIIFTGENWWAGSPGVNVLFLQKNVFNCSQTK